MTNPFNEKILKVFWPENVTIESPKGRELRRAREQETAELSIGIPNLDSVRCRGDYWAILHFKEGITTYNLSLDVASIFHTALAVELAIFIRLTERVGVNALAQGRERKRPPPFRALIRHATSEKILGEVDSRLAENVRLMRNLHAHYYNIVYLSKRFSGSAQSLGPEILQQFLEETEPSKLERLREAFGVQDLDEIAPPAEELRRRTASLPVVDFFSMVEPDLAAFAEKRALEQSKAFIARLVYDEGFNLSDIVSLMQLMGRRQGVFKYDPRKLNAFDTLSWSQAVLRKTGTLG